VPNPSGDRSHHTRLCMDCVDLLLAPLTPADSFIACSGFPK
jgi:hypothetical protein